MSIDNAFDDKQNEGFDWEKELENSSIKPHCLDGVFLRYHRKMNNDEMVRNYGRVAYCLCNATKCPLYDSNGVKEYCNSDSDFVGKSSKRF